MTIGFKILAVSASLLLATGMSAFADEATESYVNTNANIALSTLNDSDLNAAERREAFQTLMNRFTDMERVSRFVLGKYANRVSDAEMDQYFDAYSRYALATYEAQLDKYRGNAIEVTGSSDRDDRDSIVETVIRRPSGDIVVKWRVMMFDDEYQVVDVALNIDGNELWLAIEQRAQFLSILDRNNGSANALVTRINSMSEELEAEARAQRTAAAGTLSADASQEG